jgi:hypothetical protein
MTHLFAQTVEGGPFPYWWLLLVVSIGFLVAIVYLVKRIGPGGPWMNQ